MAKATLKAKPKSTSKPKPAKKPAGDVRTMTEAQRARVHPLRGGVVDAPSQEAEGWRRIQLRWKDCGDWFRRGVSHAKGAHAKRLKAIVAELDGGAPLQAKDPETEAALLLVLDANTHRSIVTLGGHANERYGPIDDFLARRWLRAGGIPFALRVLDAAPRFEIDNSHAGEAATHALAVRDAEAQGWYCFECGNLGQVYPLRRLVAAASDADYAAGRAEAIALRDGAPLEMRAVYSFVFPDEEAFSAADLAAAPKKRPGWTWGLATTRLDDADALAGILATMSRDDQPWITETHHYGLSLVDRLGEAAGPLLVGYLATAREKTAKQGVAEALALLDTTDARAFFDAVKPTDKVVGPIAAAYRERSSTAL